MPPLRREVEPVGARQRVADLRDEFRQLAAEGDELFFGPLHHRDDPASLDQVIAISLLR